MQKEIPLNLRYNPNREHIIQQWQWFRELLILIYGLEYLPPTFSETEGEIAQHKRVTEEEDPLEYFFTPAEFNFDWHCQTITYSKDRNKVIITINEGAVYPYYSFNYQNTAVPNSMVTLFLAFNKSVLELDDSAEKFEIWQQQVVNYLDMES